MKNFPDFYQILQNTDPHNVKEVSLKLLSLVKEILKLKNINIDKLYNEWEITDEVREFFSKN
ncbi:MAG: hypothetical protein N3E38_02055 [Candidatus Aenigmarchaeota archaeon]|nr:hypothetical protein [Candidatus Aenigmarchaeota archaeon]